MVTTTRHDARNPLTCPCSDGFFTRCTPPPLVHLGDVDGDDAHSQTKMVGAPRSSGGPSNWWWWVHSTTTRLKCTYYLRLVECTHLGNVDRDDDLARRAEPAHLPLLRWFLRQGRQL